MSRKRMDCRSGYRAVLQEYFSTQDFPLWNCTSSIPGKAISREQTMTTCEPLAEIHLSDSPPRGAKRLPFLNVWTLIPASPSGLDAPTLCRRHFRWNSP